MRGRIGVAQDVDGDVFCVGDGVTGGQSKELLDEAVLLDGVGVLDREVAASGRVALDYKLAKRRRPVTINGRAEGPVAKEGGESPDNVRIRIGQPAKKVARLSRIRTAKVEAVAKAGQPTFPRWKMEDTPSKILRGERIADLHAEQLAGERSLIFTSTIVAVGYFRERGVVAEKVPEEAAAEDDCRSAISTRGRTARGGGRTEALTV